MNPIRIQLILAVMLLATAALAGDTPKEMPPKVKVTGTALQEGRLCGGGARPTEEMLERAHRRTPMAGVEFRVVRGRQITAAKPTASFKTDLNGRFTVELGAGTWCAFRAGRSVPSPRSQEGLAAAKSNPNFDEACLREQERRCDEVLEVGNAPGRPIEIVIPERCPQPYNQPCYRGPMPP